MSLTQSLAANLVVKSQVAAEVPNLGTACQKIAKRNEFSAAFKPAVEWFVGNVMGAAPWIALVMVVLAGTALVINLRTDRASGILKGISIVLTGLAVVTFASFIVFTVSDADVSPC